MIEDDYIIPLSLEKLGKWNIIMKNITDIVEYLVIFIEEFAKFKNIRDIDACNYLQKHGILSILEEHYEISHTLSFSDVIDMVDAKCRRLEGEKA